MWEFIQFKYIEPEDDGIFLIFRGWDKTGIVMVTPYADRIALPEKIYSCGFLLRGC